MKAVLCTLLIASVAACGSGSGDDSNTQVDASAPVDGADAGPLNGERCGSAEPVVIPGGVGSTSISATLRGFQNDADIYACTQFVTLTSPGPDRIFTLTLEPGQRVLATVTPTSPQFRPDVYILAGPWNTCTTSCLDGRVGDRSAAYQNTRDGAVDVYIVVDTSNEQAVGEFTLDVSVDTLPPAAGDTCELAEPVTFTNGVAMLSGTISVLAGYHADYTPNCSPWPEIGNERVYSVTVPAGNRLEGTVTSSARTHLYFLGGPAATCYATCLGDGPPSGFAPTFRRFDNRTGAPVDLFVVVDSISPAITAGDFGLQLRNFPTPAGETCDAAETVDVSSGSATVSGTLVAYVNHVAPTCAGFDTTGPDHFYQLTVPAQRTLTVTVTPGPIFNPGLYLLDAPATNCTASAACLAADNTHGGGMADTLTYTNTGNAPRDVLLGVDGGAAANEGTYTLSIAVTP